MSQLPTLTSEDQAKLSHTIKESVKILSQIKDMKDSKRDLVASVSKDLDIPLRDLNRAITLAYKKQEDNQAIEEEKERLDVAEEILEIAKI